LIPVGAADLFRRGGVLSRWAADVLVAVPVIDDIVTIGRDRAPLVAAPRGGDRGPG
jgi:hypothetical protein